MRQGWGTAALASPSGCLRHCHVHPPPERPVQEQFGAGVSWAVSGRPFVPHAHAGCGLFVCSEWLACFYFACWVTWPSGLCCVLCGLSSVGLVCVGCGKQLCIGCVDGCLRA